MTRDAAIVFRSAEDATKRFARGEESNAKIAALLQAVPWDTHMLVVVPASARGEAEFEVEGAVLKDGVLEVSAVREIRKTDQATETSGSLVLLVTRGDAKVTVSWKDDTIKEMRERRDCTTSHMDTDMEGGRCGECGKAPLGSPGQRLCGDCVRRLQRCAFCLKRKPGVAPLKK